MVHKIRKAMSHRESKYKLSGLIEPGDAYFGRKKNPGKRGRGSENKSLVLAAIEVPDDKRPGFLSLKQVDNMSKETILEKISQNVKEHSVLKTDGYSTYKSVKSNGYIHYPKVLNSVDDLNKHLPWIHIILSNIKNSIKSTFHGVSNKHLQRYPDEFSYKFNRRFNEKQLFDRLLFASV